MSDVIAEGPGHGHEEHAGPNVQAYMMIGGALAIFTAVSFIVNGLVQRRTVEAVLGFAIILGVAVVKSILVALYFMHLKYDWRKVGFFIIPALILGTMFFFVLMPDIVLAWHK
jgi:caa(3)-type oxidase subunit IV